MCDFAEQLRLPSDEEEPQAERIVLVVDTLNTHGPKSLDEAVAPEEALRLAARCEWRTRPNTAAGVISPNANARCCNGSAWTDRSQICARSNVKSQPGKSVVIKRGGR